MLGIIYCLKCLEKVISERQIPVRRHVPVNGSVGYVPGVQKKRGYVPGAKRANRHGAVDMFPRTGTKNDYLFHFLVRRRDGSSFK